MTVIEIRPVPGIGEVEPGDDLAAMILDSVTADGWGIENRDIVVVTHDGVERLNRTERRYRVVT